MVLDPAATVGRKLVVLGIPWETDTEGLREYMESRGQVEDVIVMKDRVTGRSRGFGYVTFATKDEAEAVAADKHELLGRQLEVKLATPKGEMEGPRQSKGAGSTRVFVARIPPTVTDDAFRSHFEQFGVITDAYMPKDFSTGGHRGIGFVTFESAGIMAARRVGYAHAARGRMENDRVFVGRLPAHATTEDLRTYFDGFGRVRDVYIPKVAACAAIHSSPMVLQYVLDPRNPQGHRGFGFVTFNDEASADRAAARSHELLGQQVSVNRAVPQEEGPVQGGAVGPVRAVGGGGGYHPAYGRSSSYAYSGKPAAAYHAVTSSYGGLAAAYEQFGIYGDFEPPLVREMDPGAYRSQMAPSRYRPY
eukprot:SM000224S07091  [mRNA]  locus=s224:2387:5352:- [translate_table: standard]